ncbi:MAG: sigma-70 family RNA polymerase sigma factor [Lachnospiraceae bacterium]|nr:sigma-70 family RNA polymerase sigma factor [Lachnospiraceae bacterium]
MQLEKLRRDIRRLEDEIVVIDRRMEHLGSMRYDLPRVMTTPDGGYEADLDRKNEKADELKLLLVEYREKYGRIIIQLNELPAREAEVLKLYYLDGLRIRQIAHRLHYSADWVYHLYSGGLRQFEEILKNSGV